MAATLSATPRTESGKTVARNLRRAGRVPAVMYGHGDATHVLSVDAHELERLVSSISVENTLIDLAIEGKGTTRALIREMQWHPFRPIVLHVDFYQVHAGESLKLNVPVHLVGTPIGVRDQGGVLQQVLHELHIECLPKHIPEALEIDIDGLSIGDSVTVRDVSIENVTITNDPDLAICSVTSPTVVDLPEDTVEEGETEPQLVGRDSDGAQEADTTEQGD